MQNDFSQLSAENAEDNLAIVQVWEMSEEEIKIEFDKVLLAKQR